MTDKTNRRADMENPESWDWERQSHGEPTKLKRSVVSVAFGHADFQKVARAARSRNMPVSVFVRLGALEKAERDAPMLTLGWSVGNRGSAFVIGGAGASTDSQVRHSIQQEIQWSQGSEPLTAGATS